MIALQFVHQCPQHDIGAQFLIEVHFGLRRH